MFGPLMDPFRWRQTTARRLRELGHHQSADAIWEASTASRRKLDEEQARKARRRAGRRRTLFGRALNILGF